MKTNINLMMLAVISLLMTTTVQSQDYKTGIGLRLGGVTEGITVKHFVNSDAAWEGILGFGWRSFLITALYEKQKPIEGARGLYWFYGGGAHLGFYNNGYRYHKGNYVYYEHESSSINLGLDFIIGLEYKFQGAPITLGLDVKPYIDFFYGPSFYWDGAFTARYTF